MTTNGRTINEAYRNRQPAAAPAESSAAGAEDSAAAPAESSAPLPADLPSVAATAPIPPAVAAAATGMAAPRDPWALLAMPFPPELVEIKPSATTKDKKRGMAVPFVDARHYQARLDAVVGPTGWRVAYRPISERAVVCRLTVLDIVREDVGEEASGDPNQTTSAAMQAFKRACAAFGLGRYLYTDLPKPWADLDEYGKFTDERGIVAMMYSSAGIDLSRRGAYIRRIVTLLGGLDEAGLIRVGTCAAGK